MKDKTKKQISTIGDKMNSGLLHPEDGEYDLTKAIAPEGAIWGESGKLYRLSDLELYTPSVSNEQLPNGVIRAKNGKLYQTKKA